MSQTPRRSTVSPYPQLNSVERFGRGPRVYFRILYPVRRRRRFRLREMPPGFLVYIRFPIIPAACMDPTRSRRVCRQAVEASLFLESSTTISKYDNDHSPSPRVITLLTIVVRYRLQVMQSSPRSSRGSARKIFPYFSTAS